MYFKKKNEYKKVTTVSEFEQYLKKNTNIRVNISFNINKINIPVKENNVIKYWKNIIIVKPTIKTCNFENFKEKKLETQDINKIMKNIIKLNI